MTLSVEGATTVVKMATYSDIKAQNKPSFYATPVAWAAANFTQLLIDSEDNIVPHRTGIIVASNECSLSTIRDIGRTAKQGSISPLRFAGASPSILAGLPALQQRLRGPTLCLTMPPEYAPGAMVALITYWIKYADIVSVIAIAHYKQRDNHHLFKGLIVRSVDDQLRQRVLQLTDSHTGETQ